MANEGPSGILVEISVLSQAAAELESSEINALLTEAHNQAAISMMKEQTEIVSERHLSKVDIALHLAKEIDHLIDVSVLGLPDLVDILKVAKTEAERVLRREMEADRSIKDKTDDTI